MDVDFVHKECQKGKGKGNDTGKGKPKGNSKGKGKQNEKGKSCGKGKSNQENFQGTCWNCGKDRTQVERMLGGKAVKPRNKRTMSVRRRELVT